MISMMRLASTYLYDDAQTYLYFESSYLTAGVINKF